MMDAIANTKNKIESLLIYCNHMSPWAFFHAIEFGSEKLRSVQRLSLERLSDHKHGNFKFTSQVPIAISAVSGYV